MGACSQAPRAAPIQRQMETFYTWPYFSYWEVLQPNFLSRMVTHLYRPHSKFFFFFFFFVNIFVIITTIPVHARIKFFFCVAKVIQWSKSCALLPHPISLIIIHSFIVQMVVWEKSCSSSYTPSSAHAITSHSSLHDISVTTSFMHKKIISTKHLVCFSLLVTTLSFPCSLHMPLITTFLCSF